MPEYLYTADRDGTAIADRVAAPTMRAARALVENRGCQNIKFLTDDYTAALKQPKADEEVEFNFDLPAEEEISNMRSGVLGFIWLAWRGHSFFWIPLWIWNIITLYGGKPYGWGDWLGFILSGLFLVYFVAIVIPSVAFTNLLTAALWNRLNETRFWTALLRRTPFARDPLMQMELDFRLAGVMAKNSDTRAAEKLIQPYEERSENDPIVLARLGGHYHHLGDHEKGIHYQGLAAKLSNNRAIETLDYGHSLVRYLGKANEAETVINQINSDDLAELPRAYMNYTRGLLALERSQFEDALPLFRQSKTQILEILPNEMTKCMVREICAFESIALASLGRKAEAKEVFSKALPWLKAVKKDELINRCKLALG